MSFILIALLLLVIEVIYGVILEEEHPSNPLERPPNPPERSTASLGEASSDHRGARENGPSYSRSSSFGFSDPFLYNSDDGTERTLQRSQIVGRFTSLEQVAAALSAAGLQKSNLILGVDFTISNQWTGRKSFGECCLHSIGNVQNPYEEVISILGTTPSRFSNTDLIPCYGFGDVSAQDQHVFNFFPDGRPCRGFQETLSRYRDIAPYIQLAGPTSFAPIVKMAMTIVENSGGQYHVLVIISDGQVTRGSDIVQGQLSPQEQGTFDAIVRASRYPLSIVLVGVGDGDWVTMNDFDDNIPPRAFDNFQFVNYTEIMKKKVPRKTRQVEFAQTALTKIPSQYIATYNLGLLGHTNGRSPRRSALPMPHVANQRASSSLRLKALMPTILTENFTSDLINDGASTSMNPSTSTPVDRTERSLFLHEQFLCPICRDNQSDMAFTCGHLTCCDCATTLERCPICRVPIERRTKLYFN